MATSKVDDARKRLKQKNYTLPSPNEIEAAKSQNGGWTAMQLAEW